MTPRAVIIDTDPSPDDAVAFLIALASPEALSVKAITTVGGNVELAQTTRNALVALELAGRRDVPVYAGAAGPLTGTLRTAKHVHGVTGFDGYDLPEPTLRAADGFAPDRIAELVLAAEPGAITLCCLAPLTNIALALARAPEIAGRIREIVLMGGARTAAGNITPAAEYNLFVDPEAAYRVFSAFIPITMIPLDCTHQALTTTPRMRLLREIGTPLAEAFFHLLRANKRFDAEQRGLDGGPLHDPTVIAWLLRPQLFSGRRAHVAIERTGEHTRGMSVIDWWGVTGQQANALVIDQIDADGYFDLVIERLGRLRAD